jgi:hypothetical protein
MKSTLIISLSNEFEQEQDKHKRLQDEIVQDRKQFSSDFESLLTEMSATNADYQQLIGFLTGDVSIEEELEKLKKTNQQLMHEGYSI